MIIIIIIYTHLNNSRLTRDFKFQHFIKALDLVFDHLAGIVSIGNWPSQNKITGFNVFAVRLFLVR